MNIINRCFGMTHSMKSENKFAFYVSLYYYLRVTRLYASVYYLQPNQIQYLAMCLSNVYPSLALICAILLCKLACNNSGKYSIPRSTPPIYKNLYSRCHCMQNRFISNEIERRIENNKYKKTILLLAYYKKKSKKNSHTRRTHINHLPLL